MNTKDELVYFYKINFTTTQKHLENLLFFDKVKTKLKEGDSFKPKFLNSIIEKSNTYNFRSIEGQKFLNVLFDKYDKKDIIIKYFSRQEEPKNT